MPGVATTTKPEFPWEGPIPEGEFWESVPEGLARAFPRMFSADELKAASLDASLDEEGKLRVLDSILEAKVVSEEAALGSNSLSSPEAKPYRLALLILAGVKTSSGQYDEAEKLSFRMLEIADEDTQFSTNILLAVIAERQGRFNEAEEYATQALPMIRAHEGLGDDSPQALGTRRLLMEIYAQQGRFEEAWKVHNESMELVDGMNKGKFAKYEAEEAGELDETRTLVEETEEEAAEAREETAEA